ncbi:MAG TPA: class I SAM-dependent methyltransferase, partial [Bacteroidota bacterium]|nr:class I SAM-dependent methyltransferase [Bacteroidota bacterium]
MRYFRQWSQLLKRKIKLFAERRLIDRYRNSGSIPWSDGYKLNKREYIESILQSMDLLSKFRVCENLPPGYGWRIDERVVEYPWVFSRLDDQSSRLLDAGSAMNYDHLLSRLIKQGKDITVFNLAPEKRNYSDRKISYHFGDLRNMPFKDEWFDVIVCISTLEHVGMDNRGYGADKAEYSKDGHKIAALELLRVLRKNGQLL